MSRIITISISEKAADTLKKFAWGEKSKLLSDYIESLDASPNPQMLNPDGPLPEQEHRPVRQKNQTQVLQEEEYTKPSTTSGQTETSAIQHSTESSAKPNILKKLLNLSH